MSQSTILIIEDEQSLVDVLTYNLRKESFEVLAATDGQQGLRLAQLRLPDLVILDLMLPVIPGLEVCRQLRADSRTSGIPIIMLTAKGEEVDEVVGFSMGADDYVAKPFKMKPLIQRVKARLGRRQAALAGNETLARHGIELDKTRHQVTVRGKAVNLTPTEFRLLEAFLRQPGRAFTRHDLMEAAMPDTIVLERTIDVHVKSLRQKMGSLAGTIETVRGVGYRLRE